MTSHSVVPGPVGSLALIDINSTVVRVSWSAPNDTNGILLHYNISYSIDLNGMLTETLSLVVMATNVGTYSIILSDLTPFTRYRVSVSAATRIGEGESVVGFVITDPSASSPPTDLSAVSINSTAIMLTWGYPSDPRGSVEGYIITYGTSSILENEVNLTLTIPDDRQTQTIVIDELAPFTLYFLGVQAYSFGSDPFVVHLGAQAIFGPVRTGESGNYRAFIRIL